MWRYLGLLVLVLAVEADAAAPPGKTRALTKEEANKVRTLIDLRNRHADAGEFEQAVKLARQIADYRQQRQGARHWQAIEARLGVEEWERMMAVPGKDRAAVEQARKFTIEGGELAKRGRFREAEKSFRQALQIQERVLGREHPDVAISLNNVAICLRDRGDHREAAALCRKALAIREKTLGPEHRHTADSVNSVASSLKAQGKDAEALPLFRRALAVHEKTLGRHHPDTARSCDNLAAALSAQGNYPEALLLFRQALLIREQAFGVIHSRTALSYNNLAMCLLDQGKHTEALPLLRKALAIREKTLALDHPDLAVSYHHLAGCLDDQGRHAEAVPLHYKALQINEKVLGLHPLTAVSYSNLALCLRGQGKQAEALPFWRKALEINEKLLGRDHPRTGASHNNLASCLASLGKSEEALTHYRKALAVQQKDRRLFAATSNNLASCLIDQGKPAEALPLFRKALQLLEESNGSDHPQMALAYNNVGTCLGALGKHADALPLLSKALDLAEKSLGPNHPDVALCSNNLADCLWRLDRTAEAVRQWQQSIGGQEGGRILRADSGFDRAQGGRDFSAHAALAIGLARLKQPRNAFAHSEASLARGLLDDLTGLSADEAARAVELRTHIRKLESAIASATGMGSRSETEKHRHGQFQKECARLMRERTDLMAAASARAVFPLERIQKAIPADTALVLFVEELRERWSCIVRTQGTPVWVRGDFAEKPTLPKQLRSALLDPNSEGQERSKLLDSFRKERFDPLRPHLEGVKQLFIVPTGALAYIPADLFADDFAIRYIPSGTFLVRTVESHRALDASSLLALGDPIFDKAPPAEPPASGVLVLSVLPGTFASKAGLQPGDVLLGVGSSKLESHDDLTTVLPSLPANADVWRDGKTFTVRLQGSPLGAVFDKRSARAAVRAWRREREAVAQRGTGHKRLPGTRLEVEAISAVVKGSTTLVGSDASEQKLDDLIDTGKLKRYRILHFATHGEPNTQIPKRSSLILAQDGLPDPLAQVQSQKHPYDGRLTVSRIRERWQLDADLVVLSACETGLGKDAGGEGLLGFAQAFLSKGARSVVLSRWKVDDTATSLLMIRFYENLLGKRKGVKPMGRAASLDDAKKWLRTLPRKEAERLATLHTGGVLRGSEGTEKTPDKVKKIEYKGDTPFAHPYYWAAFTLIGDPD